jgi:hypothetical protein
MNWYQQKKGSAASARELCEADIAAFLTQQKY